MGYIEGQIRQTLIKTQRICVLALLELSNTRSRDTNNIYRSKI